MVQLTKSSKSIAIAASTCSITAQAIVVQQERGPVTEVSALLQGCLRLKQDNTTNPNFNTKKQTVTQLEEQPPADSQQQTMSQKEKQKQDPPKPTEGTVPQPPLADSQPKQLHTEKTKTEEKPADSNQSADATPLVAEAGYKKLMPPGLVNVQCTDPIEVQVRTEIVKLARTFKEDMSKEQKEIFNDQFAPLDVQQKLLGELQEFEKERDDAQNIFEKYGFNEELTELADEFDYAAGQNECLKWFKNLDKEKQKTLLECIQESQ